MTSSDAARQLKEALNGNYSAWQDAQRVKAQKFVADSLTAGLESMHEAPRWQGTHRFLSEDDAMPRPAWLGHDEAVQEIREMIIECLVDNGVDFGYRLEHTERDFAKGYRAFVSFRLCCDEESSVQRWRERQAERARMYVSEAVRLMLISAQQGNAEVWAKVPCGRYSNFLTKDEAWPSWIGRDAAVRELQKIVGSQLEEQGLEGYRIEPQGGPMTGTWFRVSCSIPTPHAPSERRQNRQGYKGAPARGAASQRRTLPPSDRTSTRGNAAHASLPPSREQTFETGRTNSHGMGSSPYNSITPQGSRQR